MVPTCQPAAGGCAVHFPKGARATRAARQLGPSSRFKDWGAAGAHLAPVPLVEVLHAVFHRALVGADLVVAAVHQAPCGRRPCAARSRRPRRRSPCRRPAGLDELALEGGDLLRVEELHQVERLARPAREQRRHHQHMRVPLDHDRRVGSVSQIAPCAGGLPPRKASTASCQRGRRASPAAPAPGSARRPSAPSDARRTPSAGRRR